MSEDIKALREELASEFRTLREEVAKLREQLAERYGKPQPANALDWGQPFMVGTPSLPRLAPMEPLVPGTIICGAGGLNG